MLPSNVRSTDVAENIEAINVLDDFVQRIVRNVDVRDPTKINWQAVAKTYGPQSNVLPIIDNIVEKLKSVVDSSSIPSRYHQEINQTDIKNKNFKILNDLLEDLKSPNGTIKNASVNIIRKTASTSVFEAKNGDDSRSVQNLINKLQDLKLRKDQWSHIYVDTQYLGANGTTAERRTSSIKIESSDLEFISKIDNVIQQLRDQNNKWSNVKLQVNQRSTSLELSKSDSLNSIKQLEDFITDAKQNSEQYEKISVDLRQAGEKQSQINGQIPASALNEVNNFVDRLKKYVEQAPQSIKSFTTQDKEAVEILDKLSQSLKANQQEHNVGSNVLLGAHHSVISDSYSSGPIKHANESVSYHHEQATNLPVGIAVQPTGVNYSVISESNLFGQIQGTNENGYFQQERAKNVPVRADTFGKHSYIQALSQVNASSQQNIKYIETPSLPVEVPSYRAPFQSNNIPIFQKFQAPVSQVSTYDASLYQAKGNQSSTYNAQTIQAPVSQASTYDASLYQSRQNESRGEKWTQVSAESQPKIIYRDVPRLPVEAQVTSQVSTYDASSSYQTQSSNLSRQNESRGEKWTQVSAESQPQIIYRDVPRLPVEAQQLPQATRVPKMTQKVIKHAENVPNGDSKVNTKVKKTITYTYLDDYTPSTRIYTLEDNYDESRLNNRVSEVPSYLKHINLRDDEATALYSQFNKPFAKTYDEYTTVINTGLKSNDYVQIHPLLTDKTKINKLELDARSQYAGMFNDLNVSKYLFQLFSFLFVLKALPSVIEPVIIDSSDYEKYSEGEYKYMFL